MSPRLLAALGLATLLVVPASAQDKPEVKSPTVEELIQKAKEVASEDPARGIASFEEVLKVAPSNRDALYLLSYLSAVRGEQAKDRSDRIAAFHKSTDAYARLRKLYKEPTSYEKKLAIRGQIGEARALALEGKLDGSLAAIKAAVAVGYNDFDGLAEEADFDSVRKLPRFRALIVESCKAEVAEEMARTKAFPFDFELKDTDEKTVTLADFQGKVTIVDVWGTWCGPCRLEIPHFVSLYKAFHPRGLEIVGINCNEEGTRDEIKKTIKDFAAKYKMEYPCLLNDDKTEEKIPGFQGYPTTLFIDRAGKVRMVLVGYTPEAKLEAIITTLLDETARP